MSPTELDALLTVLRAHGVAEYQAGDMRVSFAPTVAPFVPASDDDEPIDQELPPGVLDPRRMLAEAHRRAAARAPVPRVPEGEDA